MSQVFAFNSRQIRTFACGQNADACYWTGSAREMSKGLP